MVRRLLIGTSRGVVEIWTAGSASVRSKKPAGPANSEFTDSSTARRSSGMAFNIASSVLAGDPFDSSAFDVAQEQHFCFIMNVGRLYHLRYWSLVRQYHTGLGYRVKCGVKKRDASFDGPRSHLALGIAPVVGRRIRGATNRIGVALRDHGGSQPGARTLWHPAGTAARTLSAVPVATQA